MSWRRRNVAMHAAWAHAATANVIPCLHCMYIQAVVASPVAALVAKIIRAPRLRGLSANQNERETWVKQDPYVRNVYGHLHCVHSGVIQTEGVSSDDGL